METKEEISRQQPGSDNDNVDETLLSDGEETWEKHLEVALEEMTTNRKK